MLINWEIGLRRMAVKEVTHTYFVDLIITTADKVSFNTFERYIEYTNTVIYNNIHIQQPTNKNII